MEPTWFDRALGVFAPNAARNRVRARHQFEQECRAYAGAALGRNTAGWRATSTSADAELHGTSQRLRDRHRDLVRNNAHAARAVGVLVNNIVGTGITARPNTGDEATDKKIKAVWDTWATQLDYDDQLDLYGLQSLAVREMVEGGEVLGRRKRLRLKKSGPIVPLQLQLLEADFLDHTRTGDFQKGVIAINGVQFDVSNGKRIGYWLWNQHPGNNFVFMQQTFVSEEHPASEILHLYEKQRTQVRGAPWGAPVMRDLRDLSDYEFAEIQRKKTEASVVGMITSDPETDPGIGSKNPNIQGPCVTDVEGNIVEQLTPAMFLYLRNGKDVKFNNPAIISGYAEYKKSILRTIAAGYRIPYELLSGDLSDVNFSSIRAGIVEFRRFVKYVQWQVVIPMFLQPLWEWFTEAAYIAGKIPSPDVPVVWSPPKWEWVDPYKDALAEVLALRAGTRSYQEVIAEHGRGMDEVLEEIQAFNKLADKFSIVLDSDPRKVTQLGAEQPSEQPQPQLAAPKKAPAAGRLFQFPLPKDSDQ